MEAQQSYTAEGCNSFAAHGPQMDEMVKLLLPVLPESEPRGANGVSQTLDTERNSPDEGGEKKDEPCVLVTDDHADSLCSRTTPNNVAQMGIPEPSQVQIGERVSQLHSPVPSTVTVRDQEAADESLSDEEAGTSCQPTPGLSLEEIKLDETSDLSDPEFDDEPCQEEWSGDGRESLEEQQGVEDERYVRPADVGGASMVRHDSGGVSTNHKPGWSSLEEDHPGEGHANVEEGVVGLADVSGASLLLHDSGGVSNHKAKYTTSGRGGEPTEPVGRRAPGTSLTETTSDALGPQPEQLLPAQPGSQLQVVGYSSLDGEELDVNDPAPDPDPVQPPEVCTCCYHEMADGRSE